MGGSAMTSGKLNRVWFFVLMPILAYLVCPAFVSSEMEGYASAQDVVGDGGADADAGVDGGADGGGTDVVVAGEIPGAGIVIDAHGILSVRRTIDTHGRLDRRRRLAARAALEPDLARASKLRKISLNRLENAVTQQLAKGETPTDEMQFLAGLTDIRYVFFYPETKDVVIAGPAEGFMLDAASRPVGIVSGRAIMQLEDLLVRLAYLWAQRGACRNGWSLD